MKKYLISGIGPGPAGVGRLMTQLTKEADKYNYKSIYKFANKSVRKLLKEKKFIQLFVELFMRLIKGVRFNFLTNSIKNAEIILLHPQSIGIENIKKLIKNNSVIKWYVMDNSFFCMKSYNYLDGECLKCLDSFDKIDASCKPYPNPYSKNDYIEFMNFLKKNIKNIKVFAQSKSHKELLHKFYGQDVDISVVGMNTGEFDFSKNYFQKSSGIKNETIVFHNHLVGAKGFFFAYKLAKKLPQYNFIFPAKQPRELENIPNHIKFLDISWDSGLKEEVENASLVLCLSMWSSPIEGALVKSIYYNGNVAVMNNQYGFNIELPDDGVLKLDIDLDIAIKQVKEFMTNIDDDYKIKSRGWLISQYNSFKIDKLFE